MMFLAATNPFDDYPFQDRIDISLAGVRSVISFSRFAYYTQLLYAT
jgi:hypothetical protein